MGLFAQKIWCCAAVCECKISFRSYEEKRIYQNFTEIKEDLVLSHVAVFETFTRISDYGVVETSYLASCITLMSNAKVPAGARYNVLISDIFLFT